MCLTLHEITKLKNQTFLDQGDASVDGCPKDLKTGSIALKEMCVGEVGKYEGSARNHSTREGRLNVGLLIYMDYLNFFFSQNIINTSYQN